MDEPIIESCGNVFLDLGFPPDEAARHLGITQSRVSDLVRGKWKRFSLDMLITLAIRSGIKVDMSLAA